MESKILQSLRQSIKKDFLPDFTKMDKGEIIDYINRNFNIKEMLSIFVKSTYLAVQQSFYDNDDLNKNCREFSILEGKVVYDLESDQYIFTPNSVVKKLLDSSDQTNSTRLRDVLSSRFYKIIEYLYTLEFKGEINKNNKKEK